MRQLAALPAALPDEPGMPGVPGARMVEPPTVAAPRRSQRSVFDEALRYLDAVTILVPRTHTHGLGGILDASARARVVSASASPLAPSRDLRRAFTRTPSPRPC